MKMEVGLQSREDGASKLRPLQQLQVALAFGGMTKSGKCLAVRRFPLFSTGFWFLEGTPSTSSFPLTNDVGVAFVPPEIPLPKILGTPL